MTQRIPPDLLRDMVREILKDVVESEVSTREGDTTGPGPEAGRWRERVPIASQGDLDRAIRRVLVDAIDPQRRGAIERGDITFVLEQARTPPVTGAAIESVLRVDKGVVSERQVRAAAEAASVIVAARGIVVTPLAKDKARALGVVIRRES
jgi:hypothetical protein